MSDPTETDPTETAAAPATEGATDASSVDTLPPATEASAPSHEEEGLSDAELSAQRGLSHKDGPREPHVPVMQRLAAARKAAADRADKEAEAK